MSKVMPHVHGAYMQPPTSKVKGRGQAQTGKREEIDRQEVKEVLDSLITELSNAIANYRDSHGGKMEGVAVSAALGATYALECAKYLQCRL